MPRAEGKDDDEDEGKSGGDSKDAKVPAHCNAHAGNRLWANIKAAAVHALRCAEATIIDG